MQYNHLARKRSVTLTIDPPTIEKRDRLASLGDFSEKRIVYWQHRIRKNLIQILQTHFIDMVDLYGLRERIELRNEVEIAIKDAFAISFRERELREKLETEACKRIYCVFIARLKELNEEEIWDRLCYVLGEGRVGAIELRIPNFLTTIVTREIVDAKDAKIPF